MKRFQIHLPFAAAIAAALLSAQLRADDTLVVLPQKVALTSPTARQALVIETRRGNDFLGEAAGNVEWSSSDDKIVTIKDGIATPVGNGTAKITAKIGSQIAAAEVTVSSADRPAEVSFRNQVQSVLAKCGCNSGACHGAAAGKNGFKLSLRGYDADADWFTITRQARGRRVVPSDPGRSLVLLKPSGALPHKGGVRFEVDSPDYNIIA
ncbi:MAG TPA: S-layer protein, partial [Pirellulales bacterium]|nr:S-layer protein [Pirellulales bacterium]